MHPCAYAGSSECGSNLEGNTCNVLGTAAFYDALNRDWHRYQRYQNIFSILSIEIDYYYHFAAVLGENLASNLIAQVITNIGSSLRRSDIIGQVGANRFIILLSNSDRKSALKVAHMLLDNLHQQTCADLPFIMSASIGAVSVEDKQSLDKTLERADNALQRSIELGRNQVTFWG
ncbi:MAG: GGDEF domain-containing protein [Desulfuromonadaceae bacterium]